jgi:hypothetical protein
MERDRVQQSVRTIRSHPFFANVPIVYALSQIDCFFLLTPVRFIPENAPGKNQFTFTSVSVSSIFLHTRPVVDFRRSSVYTPVDTLIGALVSPL